MNAGVRREDRTLVVELAGDWELEQAPPRFGPLVEDEAGAGEVQVVDFDAAALGL